jgi:hypothetical protein
MIDLQTLLDTIEQLPVDALETVSQVVDRRKQAIAADEASSRDLKARIAALHAATANFWEGFSEAEIDEITADMNREYIKPEDPTLFAWIDDLSEDER